MSKANAKGYFKEFGGQYVPETLFPALEELNTAYQSAKRDNAFNAELKQILQDYVGRPTALYLAKNASKALGIKLYLKREDLNHTGAHKINNTIGQILLSKKMGKKRIIAETGAGQHGVATATAAALMGLDCHIYMGEEDMRRQSLNVQRMQLLGAQVIPVSSGAKTLKDATSEAIRDWMKTVEYTHYIIGSVVGPHPFPSMVRDFQSIIGKEAKAQIKKAEGRLPDAIVACVGGGSNAMGIFHPFINDRSVDLYAIEAAGKGLNSRQHAASLQKGSFGVLHGAATKLLQSKTGQINLPHSISAGLDYPGVGPELAALAEEGRITLNSATDKEAISAFQWLCKTEGIIPALETAHAIAALRTIKWKKNALLILNISGRGDKDMGPLTEALS